MTGPDQDWEVAARSETGYVRTENQDRMSRALLDLGQIYIVADGMGGHKGGAFAAELTRRGLQQHLEEVATGTAGEEAIRTSFEETNKTVFEKAHSGDPNTQGMGSTAVLLLASGSAVRVAHVGDSRAYLYRKSRLERLTTDHTQVQRMLDASMLTPEEARNHPDVGILDRAIGTRPEVEVDISPEFQAKRGDAILLCSDGLCGYVEDSEIEAVLRSRATVQEVPPRLVELALEKGGEDNVTIQFIQYGERTEAPRPRGKRATKELPLATKAEGLVTQDRQQKRSSRLRQFVSGAVIGMLVSTGLLYVLVVDRVTGERDNAHDTQASLQEKLNVSDGKIQKLENELADLEGTKQGQSAALQNVVELEKQLGGIREELEQTEKKLSEAEETLTQKGEELENLRQLNDDAKKMALEKAKQGLKILLVMRKEEEQSPRKKPLPDLVAQVGRVEILIVRPDELGESESGKELLPKQKGFYYPEGLSAEMKATIKELPKVMGISDDKEYTQAVQGFIADQYPSTSGHLLVIYSNAED